MEEHAELQEATKEFVAAALTGVRHTLQKTGIADELSAGGASAARCLQQLTLSWPKHEQSSKIWPGSSMWDARLLSSAMRAARCDGACTPERQLECAEEVSSAMRCLPPPGGMSPWELLLRDAAAWAARQPCACCSHIARMLLSPQLLVSEQLLHDSPPEAALTLALHRQHGRQVAVCLERPRPEGDFCRTSAGTAMYASVHDGKLQVAVEPNDVTSGAACWVGVMRQSVASLTRLLAHTRPWLESSERFARVPYMGKDDGEWLGGFIDLQDVDACDEEWRSITVLTKESDWRALGYEPSSTKVVLFACWQNLTI